MELKDLLFAPIYITIIYAIAYIIKPRLSDNSTAKYFISAISLKIFGAIAIGLIYHYFYQYGDTLRYHFFSQEIHEQLWTNPLFGLKILFSRFDTNDYKIAYHLNDNYFFKRGNDGFLMLKICGILGLLNMHSYYSIAVLFGFISFFGIWALFNVFYKLYPSLHKELFITFFCVPSVIFWGSGILKDTVTFSSLGWLTYGLYQVFINKKISIKSILIIGLSIYILTILKIYIILCFIPGMLLWISNDYINRIKSPLIRYAVTPMIVTLFMILAYVLVQNVSLYDSRYSLENLEETMSVTASWITYTSGESGSAYTLGNDFDLSLSGVIKKLPAGINVTLFRPYLWEVKNAVMLFASLESLILLILTIYVLLKVGIMKTVRIIFNNAVTKFLLFFSLSFAFAVGISTYNFGSLVRYKIPCIPFYIAMLFIVLHYSKKVENSQIRSDY